jgi:hypothetical protein
MWPIDAEYDSASNKTDHSNGEHRSRSKLLLDIPVEQGKNTVL